MLICKVHIVCILFEWPVGDWPALLFPKTLAIALLVLTALIIVGEGGVSSFCCSQILLGFHWIVCFDVGIKKGSWKSLREISNCLSLALPPVGGSGEGGCKALPALCFTWAWSGNLDFSYWRTKRFQSFAGSESNMLRCYDSFEFS